MRWTRITLLSVGLLLGALTAQAQHSSPPLVLDHVTVIDVQHGQRIPAQRVVIIGNRIKTMGSSNTTPVPQGAKIVDASGMYLIPGLWDMHTHSRRYTDFFYPLYIANGVTGIRDAWSEVPLDTTQLWRREILAGTRIGPPRQLLPGPALDEQHPCNRAGQQGHICVGDSADARHVVDSLKAAGADFIKTYGLTEPMYFVVAAEARRVGIHFGGHLNAGSALMASDSGVSFIDHIESALGLNPLCLEATATVAQCQPAADRMRRNGTWLVPTSVRSSHDGVQPHMGDASEALLARLTVFAHDFWAGTTIHEAWLRDTTSADFQIRAHRGTATDTNGLFRIARQVKLPILAGTDVGAPVMTDWPPGFALHAELAIYVTEGLTPLQALQAATLNPAIYLHGTDSLGTVAPGKLADLVLLAGDPLQDITNIAAIRAVVANGRYFDRAALDSLLADVQTRAKQEPQPLGQAR